MEPLQNKLTRDLQIKNADPILFAYARTPYIKWISLLSIQFPLHLILVNIIWIHLLFWHGSFFLLELTFEYQISSYVNQIYLEIVFERDQTALVIFVLCI